MKKVVLELNEQEVEQLMETLFANSCSVNYSKRIYSRVGSSWGINC